MEMLHKLNGNENDDSHDWSKRSVNYLNNKTLRDTEKYQFEDKIQRE